MSDAKKWYLRTAEGVFGPETEAQLVEWAERGAVLPGQAVSRDKVDWKRVEDVSFLDMRFGIDMGDGQVHGPLNKIAVEKLLESGSFSQGAKMIEVRPPFGTEKEAVREARAEAPVEKIVEKVVEKVVVDETRVKELEALLKEAGTREAGLGEELKTSKARIEELEGREKEAQAREAGLGEELKTSKARIEELEGREKEAQARIKKIQAEKIDATTRLTSALKIFTDRESSFNIRLMAAKSSADEQANRIAELEKAMEESRAREEVSRGELESTKGERDSLRGELDAAKAATVAETKRATGIQTELDAARGELESTKGERDSLRGELDAAKAATVAETERATGIQAELDAARGELESTKGELDVVRGDLEAAKGEHDSLRGELEGVNVKMAELEASLKEAGARETTLREELDAAKARRLEVKPSASGGIRVGDVRRLETALAGELSAAKKKGSGFAYEFFAFMQSKHRKASPLKGKEQQEPLNDKEQQT